VLKIQRGNLFQVIHRDLVGTIFQSQYQHQPLQLELDESSQFTSALSLELICLLEIAIVLSVCLVNENTLER